MYWKLCKYKDTKERLLDDLIDIERKLYLSIYK